MKTNFNTWLISKILAYLTIHEGCELLQHSERTVIQDAFGFQYEVQVHMIGRVQQMPKGIERRIMDIKAGV